MTIPNSVTSLGDNAFCHCTSLQSVTISNSLTSIGRYVFTLCSSLPSVTIPPSVTSIGEAAFRSCSSLTSITIPPSVTSIGRYAFDNCSSVTDLTIPNSVATIGSGAFSGCSSLPSVTIPSSVTSIGNMAFDSCSGLVSMKVDSTNPIYDSRDDCNAIIETASNTLIAGCQNTVIPTTVTAIGNSAFSGCSTLVSITIPNSVTRIDYSAFSGCSGLQSVTIPNSVTSIASGAFYECSGLQSVSIPNSVKSITYATFFGCSSLSSVTIPASVTSIDEIAFLSCTSLSSVTIPASVTSIGNWAFEKCTSLSDVYCYIADPSAVTMGRYIFYLEPDNPSGPSDYSGRTLHVRFGTAHAYRADENWNPYFGLIVENLIPGDVNRDGEVNIADVNAVVGVIQEKSGDSAAADVNGDGEINIADINAIIAIIQGDNMWGYHEYVDLGLPSGTMWATCNVGAGNPEDYGDYFAWGETAPKSCYDWSTYMWCDGSKNSLTKYCTASEYGTVDNKAALEPDDDAAWANWGPMWCTPTQEQMNELIHKCTWTMAQRNGVNGQLVTGPNGNKIFLPAAGYRDGNSLVGANLYCHYWTGTIYSMWPSVAYYLYCYMNEVTENGVSRFVGHPVRPVRAPQN